MRKNLLTTSALAIASIAILALSTAPLPIATAGGGGPSHDDDPCYETRHYNAGNVEFALWEAYCDDVVEDLHLRSLNAEAQCRRAAGTAIHQITRFCRRHCQSCETDRSRCRHIPRRAKNMARVGKFEVGKCSWDTCMDYDAIYDAARAQLDGAGYACLVQKLYVKYQNVKQHSVHFQRHANNRIERATRDCRCNVP
jgi:hypothetical protein